jgi:hypothetical protein
VIVKTYSVTNLAKDAVTRYSPAQVVAVSREAALAKQLAELLEGFA